MKDIWSQLNDAEGSVRLDGDGYEAIIYQGVKVIKEDDNLTFLSTESDMYVHISSEIVDVFYSEGLEAGVKAYKLDKYNRLLASFPSGTLSKRIQEKISKL